MPGRPQFSSPGPIPCKEGGIRSRLSVRDTVGEHSKHGGSLPSKAGKVSALWGKLVLRHRPLLLFCTAIAPEFVYDAPFWGIWSHLFTFFWSNCSTPTSNASRKTRNFWFPPKTHSTFVTTLPRNPDKKSILPSVTCTSTCLFPLEKTPTFVCSEYLILSAT